jgi:hypothetical protein
MIDVSDHEIKCAPDFPVIDTIANDETKDSNQDTQHQNYQKDRPDHHSVAEEHRPYVKTFTLKTKLLPSATYSSKHSWASQSEQQQHTRTRDFTTPEPPSTSRRF